MCKEDHLLGRRQRPSQASFALSTVSQPVAAFARDRAAIIFDPPSAGTVTLSLLDPAAAGIGLTLRSTDPPLILNVIQHGGLVTAAWRAVASAGTPTFAVFESYLPL